jgi:isopropylmalate/homocitrate/citramalate synthase
VIGKHSGRASLRAVLASRGTMLDANDARRMLSRLRALANSKKGEIDPRELTAER